MKATERDLCGVVGAERAGGAFLGLAVLLSSLGACGEATHSSAAAAAGSGGSGGMGLGVSSGGASAAITGGASGADTGGAGIGGAGTGGAGAGGVGAGGSCGEAGPIPITQAEREALYAKSCSGQVQELPQVLELVVDISESMNEAAPEYPGRTKWEVTRDALLELVVRAEGPGLQEYVALGLQLFPNNPGSACVNPAGSVPIARLGPAGSAQRELLAAALRSAEPGGGTPLAEAYRLAESELSQTQIRGTRKLVVVTDGSATFAGDCAGPSDESSPIGPDAMLEEVWQAGSDGEKTSIVATPGSEANPAVAFAGRADRRHFAARLQ